MELQRPCTERSVDLSGLRLIRRDRTGARIGDVGSDRLCSHRGFGTSDRQGDRQIGRQRLPTRCCAGQCCRGLGTGCQNDRGTRERARITVDHGLARQWREFERTRRDPQGGTRSQCCVVPGGRRTGFECRRDRRGRRTVHHDGDAVITHHRRGLGVPLRQFLDLWGYGRIRGDVECLVALDARTGCLLSLIVDPVAEGLPSEEACHDQDDQHDDENRPLTDTSGA